VIFKIILCENEQVEGFLKKMFIIHINGFFLQISLFVCQEILIQTCVLIIKIKAMLCPCFYTVQSQT